MRERDEPGRSPSRITHHASRTMRFHKYQGAGNDCVIVTGESSDEEEDWPAVARVLCTRRWAVGADGLLVCQPSGVADLRMRMYNPDGTEDMCGNGLRCLALYAVDEGMASASFRVETLAGVRAVQLGGRHGRTAEIWAGMGRADRHPTA